MSIALKALEAEQFAQQTGYSDIKEQFLKIAQQWREMAAYEESAGSARGNDVQSLEPTRSWRVADG
jgi:hypothetical protein